MNFESRYAIVEQRHLFFIGFRHIMTDVLGDQIEVPNNLVK